MSKQGDGMSKDRDARVPRKAFLGATALAATAAALAGCKSSRRGRALAATTPRTKSAALLRAADLPSAGIESSRSTITVSALGAVTFTEQFSNPSNTTLTTHPPC